MHSEKNNKKSSLESVNNTHAMQASSEYETVPMSSARCSRCYCRKGATKRVLLPRGNTRKITKEIERLDNYLTAFVFSTFGGLIQVFLNDVTVDACEAAIEAAAIAGQTGVLTQFWDVRQDTRMGGPVGKVVSYSQISKSRWVYPSKYNQELE